MRIKMFKVDEWKTTGLLAVQFDKEIFAEEGIPLVRQELVKRIPDTRNMVIRSPDISSSEMRIIGKKGKLSVWTYSFKIDHLKG